MELPFISCKCITYGRINTLEEAVKSFLLQDYPSDKCELVIVNDYPLQTIIFDHPQIKIYNLEATFSTIGEKENFAIEQCKGEMIAVWDDDDIALSNHLNNIAKYFVKGSNLLHWQNSVFFNEDSISRIIPIGNSGIVYSKDAWRAIGKSPIENAGGDMTMVIAMHNLGKDKVVLARPDNEDCSWFYRWGGDNVYHQSGMGTDTDDRPNIIERHSKFIENQRRRGKIPTGNIVLNPNWKQDYKLMLKKFIQSKVL